MEEMRIKSNIPKESNLIHGMETVIGSHRMTPKPNTSDLCRNGVCHKLDFQNNIGEDIIKRN
jgi:hypothetical protein